MSGRRGKGKNGFHGGWSREEAVTKEEIFQVFRIPELLLRIARTR
jgi:hypothetical protein